MEPFFPVDHNPYSRTQPSPSEEITTPHRTTTHDVCHSTIFSLPTNKNFSFINSNTLHQRGTVFPSMCIPFLILSLLGTSRRDRKLDRYVERHIHGRTHLHVHKGSRQMSLLDRCHVCGPWIYNLGTLSPTKIQTPSL